MKLLPVLRVGANGYPSTNDDERSCTLHQLLMAHLMVPTRSRYANVPMGMDNALE